MSSRRTSVDEFESFFKSSLKPTVEVQPLPLTRLLAVIDAKGSAIKREALMNCCVDLAAHKQLHVYLLAPLTLPERRDEIDTMLHGIRQRLATAGVTEVTQEVASGAPHSAILETTARWKPSLLLMSTLFGEDFEDLEHYTLGSTADRVLSTVTEPILLIEGTVPDVSRLWSDILVYVEDSERNADCLAATRALADKNAHTHLFHVIDNLWLRQLHQALELAAEVPVSATEEALLRSLRGRMSRYLQGAQEHLAHTGHQASFEILQGDPVDVTRQQIQQRKPGLLICNSVAPDHKLIDSIAYNLAAYVREVPLLLC